MIHPVTVVPIFDPIITLIACVRFIKPDETNPTAITVMIELDCTIIVENIPVATPAKRLVVIPDMNFLSPAPPIDCNPSERCFIPKRKHPSPPAMVITETSQLFILFSPAVWFYSIKVVLKYTAEKKSVISGLKRISKPGLRVYAGKDELPKVLDGLGIAIVSTSGGIMTDKEARKAGLGGDVLCFVW